MTARTDNKKKGGWAERAAARYLQLKGHTILTCNYTRPTGEVDIISQDGDTLVFTEVKYRADLDHGTPGQAVNAAKQRHIIRTAMLYLQSTERYDADCRFDVVEVWKRPDGQIAVHHIPGAFQADRGF